jgi:hypothetical protein
MPLGVPILRVFVSVTTVVAGALSIWDIFWPLTARPGQEFTGHLDSTLMAILIAGVILVLFRAIRRSIALWKGAPVPPEAFGPLAGADNAIRMGCRGTGYLGS